jgi:hypothetical protein
MRQIRAFLYGHRQKTLSGTGAELRCDLLGKAQDYSEPSDDFDTEIIT